MTWRIFSHSEAPGFIYPSLSEYVCTYQCSVCTMWYVSVSPSLCSLQGHCRVNPSLPACFATEMQLFITTSWLASELCPTVSNCYTGKPKHSLLTPPHAHTNTHKHRDTSEQMEARWRRRRGGGKNIFLFVPLPDVLVLAVDRPVWLGDCGQIRCYQTEGRHSEHFDLRKKLDLCLSSFIYFISSKWAAFLLCCVRQELCLYCTIMS